MNGYYPKELFSINEERTKRNREEYDRKREHWYKVANELFNYDKLPFTERLKVYKKIDEAVGYSL